MPHATECSTNLITSASVPLSSSPIQIPISGPTGYGRNSSSYSTSTVATTLDDLSEYICNPADNMNVSFDQSYQASSDEGSTYTPTITSDPVTRNLQPGYPRDYNCCGTDHQNLHDFLQHVDNSHPGFIVDYANGSAFPFEHNTVYSQDRWDLMSTFQIPVPSVSTPLTTLTPNSLTHEQKNINLNPSTTTPLYSINISSIPSNKQKGNGLGHLNGYNQSGIGQFDRYDQINDINGIMTGQENLMLAYQLSLIYDSNSTNPLRDPNFSPTLYGDQTLSSNPSSISTSLDDDNPLFDIPSIDIPSKALQMNQHQDPFSSPLLSIPSYPPTPSSDDNSVVVSPISKNINTKLQDNSYGGTINTSPISSNNDVKCSMSSNQQQPSYGSSISNNISNSRQRPISSSSNDAHSHVTVQQSHSSSINLSATSHQLSFDNVKNEQGSIDTSKPLSIVQRCSPTSKLITNCNQSVSPTISNHRQSYGGYLQTSIASIASNIDSSSTSQPRRSSTPTIHQSQSTATTMSQNEQQYRSINMSSLGQGNMSSSGNNVRPIAHLRRSSTSNLTPPTRTTAYCPLNGSLNISIDKNAYMSSQYSVDGYPIVGHVSSGETSSGAVTPFSSKYHPIQPKAGVAMSDVYTDPALDIKGSKKRTVSTPSVDIKSAKKRVTKSSDESVSEASVNALPNDMSSEVENRSEADIYPYKCVIPGCPKAYKNANGLKYHNEHGHASQSGNGAREKPWACHIGGCLKTYSSKGGLIYHVKRCHPNDLWALP